MKKNKISKLKMENGVLKGGFSFLTTSQISKIKGGTKSPIEIGPGNEVCHNPHHCMGDNLSCTNDLFCY